MELFFDIQDKQHDASGIEHPNLYYWAKDATTNNTYYPVRIFNEDEYHEIVREWMEEIRLPPLSLDEQDTDDLEGKHLDKYYWLLDLYDEVVDVIRSKQMVFNGRIYFGRLEQIHNELLEKYNEILDLTDDGEVAFAEYDDDGIIDEDIDLIGVAIEGEHYLVVSADKNGLNVIHANNSREEDESDLFQFKQVENYRDMIFLLSEMHKIAIKVKPF